MAEQMAEGGYVVESRSQDWGGSHCPDARQGYFDGHPQIPYGLAAPSGERLSRPDFACCRDRDLRRGTEMLPDAAVVVVVENWSTAVGYMVLGTGLQVERDCGHMAAELGWVEDMGVGPEAAGR